jgi:hypothetical protein
MKQKIVVTLLLVGILAACRKELQNDPPDTEAGTTLTLDEVRQWYKPDTALAVNWDAAEHIRYKQTDYWLLSIPGRPTFQKMQLGYRRLAFYRDSNLKVRERILEIVPDGLYLQRTNRVSPADFTGRVFIYDSNYQFLGGRTFAAGRQTGTIKPQKLPAGGLHTAMVQVITNCAWINNNYVDADGNLVVYAEKICVTSISDDSSTSGAGDIFSSNVPVGSAETGGGGPGPGSPPAASNLPGENGHPVNPQDLIKCFGDIPDQGATMKVTVYVQEPWPGTTFNMGPNSVGHTAIGLTKTGGGQSITQVVGFYPNATGLSKIHASSKIVNNGGDLQYNVSISYTVSAADFQKISNYIANPPATYDLTNFNCTNFVYSACLAGNITLPNPYNTVGPASPPGGVAVMAPGGLGDSIEKLKGQPNVNTNGGTTPISKGACQ